MDFTRMAIDPPPSGEGLSIILALGYESQHVSTGVIYL